MNDFFKFIYDNATQTGALDFEQDFGYRRARLRLAALIEPLQLDPETEEELMNAVFDLAYCAEISCLAYGFRLAAQVIRPAEPVYPARA